MNKKNCQPATQTRKPRLLDQVRHAARVRHMALSTEKAYVNWIRRFILFHQKRHPREMGKEEVEAFLTHLAVEGHVASSTQNQALAAILFLYRVVLKQELGWLEDVVRAKRPKRAPVVLTHQEALAVLANLEGVGWLIGKILYGGGLRVAECLRLRVKEVDFARLQLTLRDTKGNRDRYTMLPHSVVQPLREHLAEVRQKHDVAMRKGYGGVQIPTALERKYPNAANEWPWQYVFPADAPSVDPRTRMRRRHHLYPTTFGRALSRALRAAGIQKHAGAVSAHQNRC